jgi:hypothetical protein
LRKRLRVAFVCAFLQFGALVGVPMRPEEIQDLMRQMNAPKLAHVLPSEEDDGDPPPPGPTTAGGTNDDGYGQPMRTSRRAALFSRARSGARRVARMLDGLRHFISRSS